MPQKKMTKTQKNTGAKKAPLKPMKPAKKAAAAVKPVEAAKKALAKEAKKKAVAEKPEVAKAAKAPAKPATSKTSPKTAKAVKAVMTEVATGPLAQKWTSLFKKAEAIESKPYNMKSIYAEKTAIVHKVLGWGYILANRNDRLEVLFKDGIKYLISNYK